MRLKTPSPRTVRDMKRSNINPSGGRRARSIGLVHECAALTWIGRWCYSSAGTLAALTTKHLPARLVEAGLCKRTAMRNPLAVATYALTLTSKGARRAQELQAKIRADKTLETLAIERGFRSLLLDKSAPPARVSHVRHWTFNHDIRVQQCIAAYMRRYGDEIGESLGFGVRVDAIRTTHELETGPRKKGARIADVKMRGTAQMDGLVQGMRDAYIELETSRKRTDEVDRFCLAWRDRLKNSTARLLLICGTQTLKNAWERAFKRPVVPRYKKTETGRYAKVEGETAPMDYDPDNPSHRLVIVYVDWDVIKSMLEHPDARARKAA